MCSIRVHSVFAPIIIITPTRAIDSVIGMTMVGHGAMKTMIVTVALIAAARGFSFSAGLGSSTPGRHGKKLERGNASGFFFDPLKWLGVSNLPIVTLSDEP
jgi:hypothetical protein